MSTNYYLKRIPTKEEIDQCHQLLDKRKIDTDDLYNEGLGALCLENVLSTITEKIHIGKYSGGWRFLFRTNQNFYEKSIYSCLAFLTRSLESGLWRICDEYGETVSIKDFEQIVEKSLGGITIADYYKKHPEEKRWSTYGPQQEIAQDGSRWFMWLFFVFLPISVFILSFPKKWGVPYLAYDMKKYLIISISSLLLTMNGDGRKVVISQLSYH